jgi:hypothetical protein
MVLVSGIQHIVIKTAVVNGATHSTAHVTFKGSGVADDGTLYQVQITDTINGPRSFGLPETFPTRFTVESSFRLIGQGENNNFVTKFSEHITFNPDGRITSEFFRTGEECR